MMAARIPIPVALKNDIFLFWAFSSSLNAVIAAQMFLCFSSQSFSSNASAIGCLSLPCYGLFRYRAAPGLMLFIFNHHGSVSEFFTTIVISSIPITFVDGKAVPSAADNRTDLCPAVCHIDITIL